MSLDKIGSEQLVTLMMLNQIKSSGTESNSGVFDIIMYSVLKSMDDNELLLNAKIDNSLIDSSNNNLENISNESLNFKPIHSNIKVNTDDISNLSTIEQINRAIDSASEKYSVDKGLIRAIIKVESNFNPDVKSSAGAMGLMQLMPCNIKAYGVKNPYDINENIDAGTKYISEYIKMFDGNIEMGLMAYNAGPGTMSRRGVKSTADLYKLPKETQNYLPKVLKYYREGI